MVLARVANKFVFDETQAMLRLSISPPPPNGERHNNRGNSCPLELCLLFWRKINPRRKGHCQAAHEIHLTAFVRTPDTADTR